MIPAIIAGAATVVSGIGGAAISNAATRSANRRALEQQRELMREQRSLNEHQHYLNSFANLRRNAKAAGLNPYLALQGASGTSSSASAPSSPEVKPETFVGSAISDAGTQFANIIRSFAETNRINEDTKGKQISNLYESSTLQDKVKVWELQRKIDEKRDYMLGIDKDYHGLLRANEYAFTEYQNATQRSMALSLGLEYRYNSMFGEQRNRLELHNMKALYDKTLSDIDVNSLSMDEIVSRTHLNKAQAFQMLSMLPYLQAESASRTFANKCAGMLSNSYSSLNDFELQYRKDVRPDKVQQEKNETYNSYWRGQDTKFSSKLKKFDYEHAGTKFWTDIINKSSSTAGNVISTATKSKFRK